MVSRYTEPALATGGQSQLSGAVCSPSRVGTRPKDRQEAPSYLLTMYCEAGRFYARGQEHVILFR